MPVVVLRIDDRLIHGQVVAGWCPDLKPDLLLICDDEIAKSDWQRQLYEEAAPEYKTMICTTAETAEFVNGGVLAQERCFLIVASPKTVVKLAELGFKPDKVIIGGMHYEPGKRKVLDYVYVNDDDVESFRRLVNDNISIECRDLPNSPPTDLSALIDI